MNRSRTRAWLFRIGGLLVVVALVAGGWFWRQAALKGQGPTYETQPVERGDLRSTVTATGTVSGRDTVEVGAEVSGTISKLYVDFNDQVKAGDILLELNTDKLLAAQGSAKARLTAAYASNKSARTTSKEAQTNRDRARELAKQGLISKSELESAEAAAERAAAQVQSTSADILVAKATLDSANTDLSKAVIRAPIDGVVLSRSVEQGQTVTASLQTPVLFLIARDLTKMELSVQIDEADVGRVKEGQKATFTVDAHPMKTFEASLRSLRNVPTTTDNVVTYQAVLDVSNDDLLLRPGMTATATIVTEEVTDALLVPNAALRFTPASPAGSASPSGPTALNVLQGGGARGMRGGPGMRGGGGGNRRPAGAGQQRRGGRGNAEQPMGRLFVLEAGEPKMLRVPTGVTDGTMTEIKSGIEPGTEVITDMLSSTGK
ncbi:MAG: efflux RND transporter periplasmic adaptor subunit [Polyangiaceae bacterium]|nr:efflux RND transporter periplasmic adaptor subunit [Polyangiaceae bacterium]MCW5792524.1 efflux RND transporter periplasmic adaptor subunit [Polyangiaceae bacterium]